MTLRYINFYFLLLMNDTELFLQQLNRQIAYLCFSKST